VSGNLGLKVFIAFAKRALSEKRYRFANRRKTLDCLTALGWTISDAVDLIFSLTPSDYHEGPLDERDPNFSSRANTCVQAEGRRHNDVYKAENGRG